MGRCRIGIGSDLASLSDEAVMVRVQAGSDAAAFAELVGRWQERIRRLCDRLTGRRDRGEDLAQEVFLRLYRCRMAFRQDSRFSTYLWRIAVNLSNPSMTITSP